MVALKNLSIKTLVIILSVMLGHFFASAQSDTKLGLSFSDLSILPIKDILKLDSKPSSSASSIMFTQRDILKAYHDQLGVFCKLENNVSKKGTMQLRMRLGSLDYVDRLESKIPSYRIVE